MKECMHHTDGRTKRRKAFRLATWIRRDSQNSRRSHTQAAARRPGYERPQELLRGLGLLNGDAVLNAAVVLFIRPERVLPSYPQCQLKLARFRGIDKTEFIDNRQEYGNAFDLLQRAQRFLRDHLPVAGRVLPDLFERVDDPLYPPAALARGGSQCHMPPGLLHSRRLREHRDIRRPAGDIEFGDTAV